MGGSSGHCATCLSSNSRDEDSPCSSSRSCLSPLAAGSLYYVISEDQINQSHGSSEVDSYFPTLCFVFSTRVCTRTIKDKT